MKTGEMITALTNDRNAKLKCTNGCPINLNRDFIIGCDKDGYIKFFEHGEFRDAFFDIHNKLDWEWELIPQEVTWQGAIQAWLDGKTIKVVEGSEVLILKSKECALIFNKSRFTNGKWYILS